MFDQYQIHNLFRNNVDTFLAEDPQLKSLSLLTYQYRDLWWQPFDLTEPGVYILTGGRQIGKSTSCKLLIAHCLRNNIFTPNDIFYLPCDEIIDAKELSQLLRGLLKTELSSRYLLIIDEITYVKDWDRVIKALADEGQFHRGVCLLTGSDSVILKEAAQRFPGRRGEAKKTDYHMFPLNFADTVHLINEKTNQPLSLTDLFQRYLHTGGYLKAINDYAKNGEISEATYLTYEQWIRGDFLRRGKSEETLLALLRELMILGVSPISYTRLTQKIGLISKDTCIDYMQLLKRMDILMSLAAFDQNKKAGFPRKDQKFHFLDPFIFRTLTHWLKRTGVLDHTINTSHLVEACVASYCSRIGNVFYYQGQGEVDVILLNEGKIEAIEVKWTEQLRPIDRKALQHFHHPLVLTKHEGNGTQEGIPQMSVIEFLAGGTAA